MNFKSNFLKHRNSFFLVILLFFSGVLLYAADNVFFKHVDTLDGLSNNQINAILKDQQGFMWFGTASGLNRWDGNHMKVFLSDSRNASSLPDNYVESIQEARDGTLWINTSGGWVIYDPKTESFDNEVGATLAKMGIKGLPKNIRIDRNRNIWVNVKGEGVYYYKPAMKLMYEFAFSEQEGLPEGEICSLDECHEGMVCCYTNGRMVCLDGENKRIVWQEDYITMNGGMHGDEYHAFADRKDNIWLWNTRSLFIYKKSANEWVNSLQQLAKEWGTSAPTLEDNRIRSIAQDPSGRLWIATENSGLIEVSPNDKKIVSHVCETGNDRSIQSNNIQSLYVDEMGVVWVGTAKHGVSYYADNIFKFDAEWLGDITAMDQDANGNEWYGTSENGVIQKLVATNEIRHFTRSKDGLNSDYISSIAVSGNRVWVASPRGGINYIENGKVYNLEAGSDGTSLSTKNVQALTTDAHGNLWIGTQGFGLQCWNANTGTFTSYNVDNNYLRNDNVTSLQKAGNKILIGTSAGLAVMQIEGRKVKTYVGNDKGDVALRSTSVTSVCGDSRGYYWIGTREGVAVYAPKTDQMLLIGKEQGLNNESVLALSEDKQKNMWATTPSGATMIVILNTPSENFPINVHVINYDAKDGLQSSGFNSNSIMQTSGGKMIFGGMSGINVLNEDVHAETSVQEHLFFSQLYLYGNEVMVGQNIGGKVILPSAISSLESISLPNGATIELKLASNNYIRSEKLQFVYKLDGVDKDWMEGDVNSHGILYKNMSSGTYLLHVKSITASGSSDETTLTLIVAPPAWLSWKAIVVYVLVLLLLVYWLLKWRPKKKARKDKYISMKGKLAEISKLSQELRIPVTTLIPPLNTLIDEEQDEHLRENLTTVHYQAVQILGLANRMQGLLDQEQITESINTMQVKKSTPVADDTPVVQVQTPVQEVKKYQLLVVDDNPEFLDFIRMSLDGGNFEVLTASSAAEAWEKIQNDMPSLVVCEGDLKDEMTGSELCSQMKSSREYDKIPFILMTDSASAAMIGDNGINNRITTSADDYIAKPFNVQVLIAHINKLLGIRTESKVLQQVEREESAIESMAISATMDEQLRINAEQFVLQNISRPGLSVEEMAKSLGMSRAHLYKKLTAITGKTPIEFIRIVRLKQASLLLKQGVLNVSEVAYEVGFNNPKNFSKYFKEEFGVLPSLYNSEEINN